MTTMRQTAANARNATKSTGPKSEEGKAESRQNALKHGLTAKLVHRANDNEEITTRLTEWWPELAPVNPIQSYFARQIVIASIHVETCQASESSRREVLTKFAAEPGPRWQIERESEAIAHGEMIRRNPPKGRIELRKTPAGRAWLLAQWTNMLSSVPTDGTSLWGADQTFTALNLMGVPKQYCELNQALHARFEDPKAIRALILAEIEALTVEQAHADSENAELRELHRKGLALEEDKTVRNLRRYQTEGHRLFAQALKMMKKYPSATSSESSESAEPQEETPVEVPTSPEPAQAQASLQPEATPPVTEPKPATLPADPKAEPKLPGNRRYRRKLMAKALREQKRELAGAR